MRIILLLSVWLIGCTTTGATITKPVIVEVPVTVKCLKPEDVPVRPNFKTDEDFLSMNAGEFVRNLHIDRLVKELYINQLESIVEACK